MTVPHENPDCDNTTDTPQNVNLTEDKQPDLEDVPELGTEVEVNGSEEDSPGIVNERRSAPFMAAIDDAREKLLSVCLNQLTNAELEKYLGTKVDNSNLSGEHESGPQPSTSDGRQSRLRGTIVNYQESSMDDDSDGEIVSELESEPDKSDSWLPPRRSSRRASRHGPSSARIAAQHSKGSKGTGAKNLLVALVHLYLLILRQVAHQGQPPVRKALSAMLKMTLTYQTPHWQRTPLENEKVF